MWDVVGVQALAECHEVKEFKTTWFYPFAPWFSCVKPSFFHRFGPPFIDSGLPTAPTISDVLSIALKKPITSRRD